MGFIPRPHYCRRMCNGSQFYVRHCLLSKISCVLLDTAEDVSTNKYSLPANLQYGVEFGAFEYMDVNLTPEIYRDRLHNLLFVEEYERRKRMSRSVCRVELYIGTSLREKPAGEKKGKMFLSSCNFFVQTSHV